MKKIKVGRVEYDIQPGDYILHNGACYMFCSGDGRVLKYEAFSQICHVTLPKARVKEIPFETMTYKTKKDENGKLTLEYWFFK